MDEPAKQASLLKAEMASIIVYLNGGAADISTINGKLFQLNRRGSKPFELSSKALTYLARKGWVKRDGKSVKLSEKAPAMHASIANGRQTEEILLVEAGEARNVTRVSVESPIDYLALRKDKNGIPLLGKAEWVAGDRLRSDFTRANMLPGISMRWGEPIRVSGGAGGGVTQTDAAMAARTRVAKALEAVGPEFSGLLLDVCCFLKGLEQVEIERRWPQRSAKLMLRAGLSILSRHYAPPAIHAAKIKSWVADDNRPTF